VQEPGDADLQNAYYNGWLHSVLVTNCFCFGADGTIVWAKMNCPGSWNDGEMSRTFREKLLNPALSLQTHGVVADSAFPVSGTMLDRIEGDIDRSYLLLTYRIPEEYRAQSLACSNAVTSIRQAAEWGMGAVDKSFRRLLMPLPFDQEVRKVRIGNIMRLYNLRVRTTRISQIRSVFGSL
jgi:hypothetical protein